MKRSKLLAINALFATLILIFALIPIKIGPVSLAFLVLIPVIISGQAVSFKSALFTGTFFGIVSYVSSFMIPSPLAPLFNNPLVSILPRVFVGVAGCFTFKLVMKIFGAKGREIVRISVSSTISAVVAVTVNTGLVLVMMWLLFHGKTINGTAINGAFMSFLLSANYLVEVIGCALLVPPITYALFKANIGVANMKKIKPKQIDDIK